MQLPRWMPVLWNAPRPLAADPFCRDSIRALTSTIARLNVERRYFAS